MRPLSPRLLGHFKGWDGRVAPTRDAATIVVLRERAGRLEVFLMRRQASMAFAGGMHVFPGGGVQESDFDETVPWAGTPAREWAERFRCDARLARALVVAAVRETFEETGVLLAGPDTATVVEDTRAPGFQEARTRLEAGDISFGALLRERGLVLRADLLGAWAHWITPEFEPRRYDTRFFVALLPKGQSERGLAGEADRALWLPADEAWRQADAGELHMMPPTRHTLRALRGMTADGVMREAADRSVTTIAPRLVLVDGVPGLDGPAEDQI
ncbi:NUDIX domain-containing protein [Yinghuangia sp. ASG 101]|uniref:NUDIX hydrolase n=1 Tax=Yinghuangia sp. ASG 101 TaxID=2896848 RepID=UPI001E3C6C29|nr:NUDIX domain-containing protein [Yinghuangia sp. ASG 101]UGQ11201.1 NUDIX domain-containing protein [Yinghuangia sp. ASG 101]